MYTGSALPGLAYTSGTLQGPVSKRWHRIAVTWEVWNLGSGVQPSKCLLSMASQRFQQWQRSRFASTGGQQKCFSGLLTRGTW